MAEAALQRLHAKFGDVRIVVALRGFNELWTDQPGEIDCRNHWCCHPHWSNRESTRRRPTPPLTRGGLVWELGSRPKTGNEAPRTGTVHRRPSSLSSLFPLFPLFPLPSSLLLGVQLDDQLLLRRDRNVPAARTLEHAPAERVAIDGDPGERRAARRILHRRD